MTPSETAIAATATATANTLSEGIVAIAPLVTLVEVTDAELAKYAELIYERTGIRVSPQKKTLLSNRLRRRLRETGIRSFSDYYEHLRRVRPNDPEWEGFLQEITTHETYLFRDAGQWEWLRKTFLAAVRERRPRGTRRRTLRIWSAACSTGDEAFTAACCIVAALPNHARVADPHPGHRHRDRRGRTGTDRHLPGPGDAAGA